MRMPLRLALTLVFAGALTAACSSDSEMAPGPGFVDTTEPVPLTTMSATTYLGFEGGLYAGGNEMPADHSAAGLAYGASIEPRGLDGTPDPSGAYALLSVGMSNTRLEFQEFMRIARREPGLSPSLVIVNGALGGQDARDWASGSQWDRVRDDVLGAQGLTEAHVAAVWIKLANSGPSVSLPGNEADAFEQVEQLASIVRQLRSRYPNLRQVFLSSRIYAGYATTGQSPEPFAYEGGFAVKWLIEAQARQMATGEVDPRAGDLRHPGVAPWLAWGPYLWADGLNPNPDGLFWAREDLRDDDGTHPSDSGSAKVAEWLLRFFEMSPHASQWFLE